MTWPLFAFKTPDTKHVNVLPNATHLDPAHDPMLNTCCRDALAAGGPRVWLAPVFLGGGLEAHLAMTVEDLVVQLGSWYRDPPFPTRASPGPPPIEV